MMNDEAIAGLAGYALDAIKIRDAEIDKLRAVVSSARELLREWKTADGYTHDWNDFEERVDALLAEQ